MTAQVNQHDPQGRPHGVWEGYWPNGTLRWRRQYLHRKIHGFSEWYRADGTLSSRYHYMHGKAYGLSEWYRSDVAPYLKKYILTIK